MPVGWLEQGGLQCILVNDFSLSLVSFSFFLLWSTIWMLVLYTYYEIGIYYSTRFMYLTTIQKNCIFKRTSMRVSTYNWFWWILSEAKIVFMQENWSFSICCYSRFAKEMYSRCTLDLVYQVSLCFVTKWTCIISLYAMLCHVCRNLASS